MKGMKESCKCGCYNKIVYYSDLCAKTVKKIDNGKKWNMSLNTIKIIKFSTENCAHQ